MTSSLCRLLCKGCRIHRYRRSLFAALLSITLCNARSQDKGSQSLRFEVASVKEDKLETTDSSFQTQLPDRFVATKTPVGFLILKAFELKGDQLAGAPSWVWDKSYDVIGTYPNAQRPSQHQILLMLQQLLADRFGLKFHHETRRLSTYDLVLARKDGHLGPDIHPASMDCDDWIDKGKPSIEQQSNDLPSLLGRRPICSIGVTRTKLSAGARTMQQFAAPLEALSGRLVVDKTGLPGTYDFDMQWTPSDYQANPTAPAATNDSPTLFTALQTQLGLKLVPSKDDIDVLVIDAVRAPDSN